MKIKNVIFDFGGVLAPIDRDKAVARFVGLGLSDADTRLDKYHQTGIFQDLEEGTLSEEEYRRKLGKLCGRTLTWEETQEAWLGFFFCGVNEQALEYLEKLREQGLKLYLLSNTNPYVMKWACSERFSQKKKPLNAYFDDMFLSYQMGNTKPDEGIFLQMLKQTGMNPAETLFIDDGEANTAAGEKFGMHTFCPANGADWRADVSAILKQFS